MVAWADEAKKRVGIYVSNAGSYTSRIRCNLHQLDEINWEAVSTNR